MGFKKKVVGVLAAASLSLGLVAGGFGSVSAQFSESGEAEIINGVCALEVSARESTPDFGDWKWDGTKYVLDSGAGTNVTRFDTTVTNGHFGQECDVEMRFHGLYEGLTTSRAAHIPYGHFSAQYAGGGYNTLSNWSTQLGSEETGNYRLDLRMNSAPSNFNGNALEPGTYSGSIGLTLGGNEP